MVGVHSGTTTVVDQGGPSCMTLPGFRKFVAEPATTRDLRVPVRLSRRRARGPLLPGALRPRRRRRPRDHPRRPGERGPGPRHQGARRDRRRRALGARGPSPRRRDRPRGRPPALRPLRPALAAAQVGGGRRRPGHDPPPGGRDPPPRGRPRASRSLAIPAASSTARDTCTRSSARRSRAASASTWGTAPTSASTWRGGCWTRGSCPTRSAPISTATTPRCRGRRARRPGAHPDPELHPFAGSTRFSLARAMTGLMACGLTLEQVVPMVTRNAARMLGPRGRAGHPPPRHGRRRHGARRPARPLLPPGQRRHRGDRRAPADAGVLPPGGPAHRGRRAHPSARSRGLTEPSWRSGPVTEAHWERVRRFYGQRPARPTPRREAWRQARGGQYRTGWMSPSRRARSQVEPFFFGLALAHQGLHDVPVRAQDHRARARAARAARELPRRTAPSAIA